jgi:hypothetical protein
VPDNTAEPQARRPRMFGGEPEPVMLPWAWAVERLMRSESYWIVTTRPNGRPHARPVWGVWLDGNLFFSTGSLAVENLAARPEIEVHLESGSDVVIVEGTAVIVTDVSLVRRVVDVYNPKYHWDFDPADLPGPFYVVRPRVAFGWICDPTGLDRGAIFHGTATRWRFGGDAGDVTT